MKVYITQYALTKGILEEEVEICEGCAYTKGKYSWRIPKTHWFLTREEAVERANDLRNKLIATYERSLEKARKMTFQ